MKSATTPLRNLLDGSTALVYADLLTLTLSGGAVYRWSSADVPVTISGTTWTKGPAFKRSKVKTSIGVSVDNLDIEFYADATVTINGTPLLAFIAAGGLDGARIVIERGFSSSFAVAFTGKLRIFSGRVADTSVDAAYAKVTAHSDLELLDVPVPRNLVQPYCTNDFCDSACTLAASSWTMGGTATSTTDPTLQAFNATLTGPTGAQQALGVLTFTSGANSGTQATVKSYAGGVITLIGPLPLAVASGDTFTLLAGCDKTKATCNGVYSNVVHFRGAPYVPVPEAAA